MTHSAVETLKAPAAIGPYSQAILSGNLLFVSGQIGLKPDTGDFAGDDFSSQTHQALENMKEIIEAAGFEKSHVVCVDVFLTDMQKFQVFNDIYQNFMGELRPARAVVAVSGLPKGAQVEIKCMAQKTRD